tara:strand:- start:61 stop:375 length:315 start_codon:yes stop_codon:yes gene_type:complete
MKITNPSFGNEIEQSTLEKCLGTVIRALADELQSATDNRGLSAEAIDGDIWVDTPDQTHSINIQLNWETEKIVVEAFVYKIVEDKNNIGYIKEDMTEPEFAIEI